MEKYEKLNIDNVNVGDIIALKKTFTFGWGYHLCDSYMLVKISKITPKKTKMYFTNFNGEINPLKSTLYKPTEEMSAEIKAAKDRKFVADKMYRFSDIANSNAYRNTMYMGYMKSLKEYVMGLSVEELAEHKAIFEKPFEII